jgi:hypothetical protein
MDRSDEVRLAVYPWISADYCSLWKLQLRNLCPDSFIFQRLLLDHEDLGVVSIAMLVGAETDVSFYSVGRQIDDSFVKLVL